MLIKSRPSGASLAAVAMAFFLVACGESKPGSADSASPETGSVVDVAAETTTTAPVAEMTASKWLDTKVATEDGGFRIGNPDAKVKLVEYASLTCPHCRDFHEAAMSTLRGKYIATGDVSYEFRNFVLNPADYAATMLARCSGPDAFFALSDALFKNQPIWLEPFTKFTEADTQKYASMAPDDQIVAYARDGGLDEFMRLRGVPSVKFKACLTDAGQRKALEDIRKVAIEQYKISGTPQFVINGAVAENAFNWETLQPLLDKAVK